MLNCEKPARYFIANDARRSIEPAPDGKICGAPQRAVTGEVVGYYLCAECAASLGAFVGSRAWHELV
jgi:hypothetical protein